jgi:hypothetical protein
MWSDFYGPDFTCHKQQSPAYRSQLAVEREVVVARARKNSERFVGDISLE